MITIIWLLGVILFLALKNPVGAIITVVAGLLIKIFFALALLV
jgi:hypothetical protein